MRRHGRGLLASALGASLLACSSGERWNVVLISVDTLRLDRLSVYGFPEPTTPALDRLASESLVFERCYSHASSTCPAMASILTGRVPRETGMLHNSLRFPRQNETLAEILRDVGYRTAAAISNYVLKDRGFEQGFDTFDDTMTEKEIRRDLYERTAARTTDAALRLVEGMGREPFLLWIHYQDPHGPYTPPEEHLAPFPARADPEEKPLEYLSTNKGKGGIPPYQILKTQSLPSQYHRRYLGEIRFMDAEVGRLVEGLRQRGLLARSIVVFTADHGELLGEHGFWFLHGVTLHEELIRVPLLVRLPGGRTERIARPVSHIDIVPTLCRLLRLAPPSGLRGRDLLEPAGESLLYAETHPPATVDESHHYSLIEGGFKLYATKRASGTGARLHDLRSAGGERKQVEDLHPEEFDRLRQRLQRLIVGMREVRSEEMGEMTEEQRKALKGLGYLDGGEGDPGEDDADPSEGGAR